jgi:UDPglucose 6-dehydrogenase
VRISVIGCGYLGAVHAACMTVLGHEVVGIDVDQRKIDALRAGRAPFFEPGLPELLAEATATGRLTFSTDMADAAGADVHFICVGTPQMHGEFRADLTFVRSAVQALHPHLRLSDVNRPGFGAVLILAAAPGGGQWLQRSERPRLRRG